MIEQTIPSNHVASMIKADLQGTLVPSGTLAGQITGTSQGSGNSQLQVYTTTGIVDAVPPLGNVLPPPWGDIQKVSYYLKDSLSATRSNGKDLIRAITRNLLASGEPDLFEQAVMSGVSLLTITYYSGLSWHDSWDATAQDTPVPQAVKVEIDFAQQTSKDPARSPIEIVVPLTMQAGTNTTTSGSPVVPKTPPKKGGAS